MKIINLTKDKATLVDNKDYDTLSKHKWFAVRNKNIFYAARNYLNNGKRRILYMHRQLMKVRKSNSIVDHIDGNSLNNSRRNLRICTQSENLRNHPKRKGNTSSKFKGVCKVIVTKPWEATIQVNNKRIYLGKFKYEIEAARAYNKAAKIYHGEYARLNELS